MIRSEIRTLVRTLINEPSAGLWTDAELNTAIDLGNQKLNALIRRLNADFFTKSSTFSTVADTKSYTLPTDFVSMRRLEHYNVSDGADTTEIPAGDFPLIERKGPWPFNASGKPTRYIIRGSQFDLLPMPDAAYTMRIYYAYTPTALSGDSATPSSPTDFHDMIAYFAAIHASHKSGDDTGGFKEYISDRTSDLIADMGARKSPEPEVVVGYMEGEIW